MENQPIEVKIPHIHKDLSEAKAKADSVIKFISEKYPNYLVKVKARYKEGNQLVETHFSRVLLKPKPEQPKNNSLSDANVAPSSNSLTDKNDEDATNRQ